MAFVPPEPPTIPKDATPEERERVLRAYCKFLARAYEQQARTLRIAARMMLAFLAVTLGVMLGLVRC